MAINIGDLLLDSFSGQIKSSRCLTAGHMVRDARRCRAPHHEDLRPRPEEHRAAMRLEGRGPHVEKSSGVLGSTLRPNPKIYPTNPFIGLAAAESGNTVSASARSLRPRWSAST